MYVCVCNQITDKEIVAAVAEGHSDLDAVSDKLGVGNNCGCCRGYTHQLITEVTSIGPENYEF